MDPSRRLKGAYGYTLYQQHIQMEVGQGLSLMCSSNCKDIYLGFIHRPIHLLPHPLEPVICQLVLRIFIMW